MGGTIRATTGGCPYPIKTWGQAPVPALSLIPALHLCLPEAQGRVEHRGNHRGLRLPVGHRRDKDMPHQTDGEGFEPPVPERVQQFSRLPP